MRLRDRFLSVWNDPVWSKVIASTILAAFGYLSLRLVPGISSVLASSGIATTAAIGGS